MADWPTLDDLKAELGTTTTAKDDTLDRALLAAIGQVKVDVGRWREVPSEDEPPVPADEPDDSLSAAALVLAVMIAKAPQAPYGIVAAFDTGAVRVASTHPTYRRLLKGHRRAFGIA